MTATRAGYAALLGRPNVGKSTLLNRLIAHKISITSPKPQTTRHAILGIHTLPAAQIVYVDTPGLQRGGRRAMDRYLNRTAAGVLSFVDVVVMLVEALHWTGADAAVVERLTEFAGSVILAVNKVDRVIPKERLLPFLQTLAGKRDFAALMPISARQGDNVAALEQTIAGLLPEGDFLFDPEQLTTASERFLAAELIREKLTRQLHQELPYTLTVDIETFTEENGLLHIGAVIWVERQGQKRIVIGAHGAVLKEIGRQAREDMERLFQRKVFLQTWVKVRQGWSDDERALRRFGYQDPL